MKNLFNTSTPLGVVNIMVDEDAKRQVAYLYFDGIMTPAKGKRPASIFTMTVSDYKGLSGSVAVIPSEAVSKLVGFSQPLINSKANSDSAVIKDSFTLIDKMVEEFEATRESASGPVIRKVDESITSLLARVYLVAAGVTGNIPETLDLSAYLSDARKEAENISETLGKDTLNQFRLKKAKEKKEEPATSTEEPATSTEDPQLELELDGE